MNHQDQLGLPGHEIGSKGSLQGVETGMASSGGISCRRSAIDFSIRVGRVEENVRPPTKTKVAPRLSAFFVVDINMTGY
jgi:hypothetical protein